MFGPAGPDHLIALNYSFGDEERDTLHASWRPGARAPVAAEGKRARFETAMAEADTMAVNDFEAQGVSSGDAAVVADLFRNEIVKGRIFNVVEKANMDKILAEQAFQQTGCTTQECAVKLGRILNVRYLVIGSFGKLLEQYVISVRVVDVESAAIVYSDVLQTEGADKVGTGVHELARRLTEAVTQRK